MSGLANGNTVSLRGILSTTVRLRQSLSRKRSVGAEKRANQIGALPAIEHRAAVTPGHFGGAVPDVGGHFA
jgi:hypothetical protein